MPNFSILRVMSVFIQFSRAFFFFTKASFLLFYLFAFSCSLFLGDKGGDDSGVDSEKQPPFFFEKEFYTFTVPENTPTNNFIGKPKLTKEDNFIFRLKINTDLPTSLTDAQQKSFIKYFRVNEEGEILVDKNLDYKVIQTFTFDLEASDPLGKIARTRIEVNVTNVIQDLAISQPLHTVNIDEDANVGTIVNSLSFELSSNEATGKELEDAKYNITAGNVEDAFSIDEDTGEIKVAKPLDYETLANYTLDISASLGDARALAKVEITINNVIEIPGFRFLNTPYTLTVTENVSLNTNVGVPISATATDTTIPIRYSLLATGNESSLFRINSNTGQITTSGNIDFESAEMYNLQVKVEGNDGTNLETIIENVVVNVTNITDADGLNFGAGPFVVTVAENSAVSTSVGTFLATAPDAGVTVINYTIQSTQDADKNNVTGIFNINANTGEITVATASLDFETSASYTLSIRASALGVNTETLVNVNLSNEIEADGLAFTKAIYSFSIEENSINLTPVDNPLQASATDTRLTGIIYTIVSGNTNSVFRIDQNTGQISTTTQSLDFETNNSYTLGVEAVALGITATASVNISVTDILDADDLAFLQVTYASSVLEESPVATRLSPIPTATVADPNVTIHYALVANADSPNFTINANTGEISTAVIFDFEASDPPPTFSLTVRASAEGHTADTTVNVSVTNRIEANGLAFAQATYPFTVREDANANDVLGVLSASADDPNLADIRYEINSGNADGIFSINGTTGVLSVANVNNLDFETTTSYTLAIESIALEGTPLEARATTSAVISIQNVVEIAGFQFTGLPYIFTVAENLQIGANVGTVIATTTDPSFIIQYSIISGNENDLFEINANTGLLTLKRADLDFETLPNAYNIGIRATASNATDSDNLESTLTVNVTNVTDADGLSFGAGPFVATIAENSAVSTSVGTFSATAPDTGVTAINYTIQSTQDADGNNVTGIFNINANTGEITVATASFDFETSASYTLSIRASALGIDTDENITIQLSNEIEGDGLSFVDGAVVTRSIDENAVPGNSADNAYIAQAIDTRVSQGDIAYSIVSEDGATPATFIMDGNGVIRLASGQSLNYELKDTYILNIEATAFGVTATGTVNLNVNNIQEADDLAFGSATYIRSIPENNDRWDNVDSPIVVNPLVDTSVSVNYNIPVVADRFNFIINTNTGQIKAIRVFDREVKDTYSITIRATALSNSVDANVIITIDNVVEADGLSFGAGPFTANVAEDRTSGTAIATFTARALDSGLTGINYSIQSIVDGDGNTVPSTLFQMNATTGEITVNGNLDFETMPSYKLGIRASALGVNADATVELSIGNVQEVAGFTFNATPYTFQATESLGANSLIGTVNATATDPSFTMQYGIISGNDANLFEINANTGALSLRTASLDFEEAPNTYTLEVQAIASNATDSENISTTVTINVTDVIDANDLSFGTGPFAGNIAENSANGASVVTITATAPDPNLTGINYTIQSIVDANGNPASPTLFQMNATTGEITVNGALDFETMPSYELGIRASALGVNADETLSIHIVNIPEPDGLSFAQNTYTRNISEDAGIRTSLGAPVTAQAQDTNYTDISYRIQSVIDSDGNNVTNLFEVLQNTGQIRLAQSGILDHETIPNYTISLEARGGAFTATTSIGVTIDDAIEADNFAFINNTYTVQNLSEGASVGTVVTVNQLEARASDTRVTGILYDIIDGNVANAFTINRNTAEIIVANALDFEITPVYTLTIQASVLGVTTSATLTISLDNVLEGDGLSFAQATYSRSINENNSVNDAVGLPIVASAPDTSITIAYSILSQDGSNDSDAFSVDAMGQIRASKTFDYEAETSYKIILQASSLGINAITTVNIAVIDIIEADSLAFASNSYSFSVDENSIVGVNVGTPLQYTVRDARVLPADLSYQILSEDGNPSTTFNIDSNAQITVATGTNLDYETKNTYVLVVQAEALGVTATTTVNVSIANLVETAGFQFVNSTYNYSINEKSVAGTNVDAPVTATTTTPTNIEYSIVDGNLTGFFTINASTGQIAVANNANLDFETNALYTLTVRATATVTEDSIDTPVRVEIRDVLDGDGVTFTQSVYNYSIAENISLDTNVGGPVVAVAPDVNATNITYRIASGNVGSAFKINPVTGQIQIDNTLDHEVRASYVLSVNAEVLGVETVAQVLIAVQDIVEALGFSLKAIPIFET